VAVTLKPLIGSGTGGAAPLQGILLRYGDRWGPNSIAWARAALRYGGEFRPVARLPDLEVWLRGAARHWRTGDGAEIWALNDVELPELPVERLHAGGALAADLADAFPGACFLLWDAAARRVELCVGRLYTLGMRQVQRDARLFVAPEIKAFSLARKLKHIERFPPGSRVILQSGAQKIRWRTPPLPRAEPVAEQDPSGAVARCRELLENSLDRALERLGETPALSLSGGVDSSILAFMLARRGIRPRAFIAWFDAGESELPSDLVFARRVAGDLGLDLREARVDRATFREDLLAALYYGECATPSHIDHTLYFWPLLRAIHDAGLRARITGDRMDMIFSGFETGRLSDPGHGNFDATSLHVRRQGQQHIWNFHRRWGVDYIAPFFNAELLEPDSAPREVDPWKFTGRFLQSVLQARIPKEPKHPPIPWTPVTRKPLSPNPKSRCSAPPASR
jgi:hypothetical protein